jgi:oligosaccharide reducing-end xylanase
VHLGDLPAPADASGLDARRICCLVQLGFVLALSASCTSTLDSLGCNERHPKLDGGSELRPLYGPSSYPNAFRDRLGKSDSEITARISKAFDQLFHGDAATEAIYVEVGTDQAYIHDLFHDQIRSEGMGIGMIITVELDKREEFDRLWRYAKASQVQNGPKQGYFPSFCTGTTDEQIACDDPFGLQQITMALLLARGRWQNSPGSIDYAAEASALLDIIRNKEAYNCGINDDVTGTFDAKTKLVHYFPTTAFANMTGSALLLPAYYKLWQQATGDPFWPDAAEAARAYWRAVVNPNTGLMPERTTLDTGPVAGFDSFQSECFRTLVNMALDRIWSGGQEWLVEEGNRVLAFFYGQGMSSYGRSYSLDGTNELSSQHDSALVAANGAIAAIANTAHSTDFVNAVWSMSPSTGGGRYYSGILYMLSLLILSGHMQVY